MNRGWRLGRIFGIPLVIDYSWPVVAVLITWSLYLDQRDAIPDLSRGAALIVAGVGAALFFGSVLFHELSHSVLAMRRGISVRRIRLFIFGGVSEIESEAASAKDEFAIAIAGPLASFGAAIIMFGVALVLPNSLAAPHRMALTLALINAALGVFNLVPGFPLDGGRVLRAIVWRVTNNRKRATGIAVLTGRGIAVVMIGLGGVVFFVTQGGELSGLWWIAIGWFLYRAATQYQMQSDALERLSGLTAADVMTPASIAVPGELSPGELLDGYVIGMRPAVFPVVVDGRIKGFVNVAQMRSLQPEALRTRTLGEVMERLTPEDVIDAETTATEMISRFERPGQRLAVVLDGRLIGSVSAADLGPFLQAA